MILVGLSLALSLSFIHSNFEAKGQEAPAQAPTADESYQKALEEEATRTKIAKQVFEEQLDLHNRYKKMLNEQETLWAQQAAAFEVQLMQIEQYGKILDTWEKQQKQYQQHLDTLTKK
jgi:uncharacterized protein YfbU (UPF0304 family)